MACRRNQKLLILILISVWVSAGILYRSNSVEYFPTELKFTVLRRVTPTIDPLHIPALMDGDVNMPDVLYHCSRILNNTYGAMKQLNLAKLSDECTAKNTSLCKAVGYMRRIFGKQSKFNNVKALYDLGILRGRHLAKTPRPMSCNACFTYNFTTLIHPRNICAGTNPIDLLIIITSAAKDVDRRSALRETWLKTSQNNTSNVRHLFLFGGHLKPEHNAIIKQESQLFGDILQEDYVDSYYNLSYKVLSGYRWGVQNCARAKFVARSADDMYVNVPRIIKYALADEKALQTVQFGQCYKGGTFRGSYYHFTRHYQSRKDFPSNHFGPMCIGTTFVHAMAGVKGIVKFSADIPWFSLEDHWVGYAQKKAGVKIRNVPGFNIQFYPDPDIKAFPHLRDGQKACFFNKKIWMTLHRLLPKDIRNVHQSCFINGTSV